MNKENKMVNMLKKPETVLNKLPLTMKEFLEAPKKLLKFLSPYQTSNLDSKDYSHLSTPESHKLLSSVAETKPSEMNNNSTKLNSLKDYPKLTL